MEARFSCPNSARFKIGTLWVARLGSCWALALAAFLLALPVPPAEGAESWPTTRFEVFVGTPWSDNTIFADTVTSDVVPVQFLDNEDEEDLPHPSAVAEMEKALHEAAVWFEKKGLPPPLLEPLLETDNGLVYRVYLCKDHGSGFRCGFDPSTNSTSSGMYAPECTNYQPTRFKYLYLNRDQSVSGMGLNETGYQTIAHELMHAIQANTAFGRRQSNHCGSENRWIGEGIADAIGYDAMEDLWKGKYAVLTDGSAVAKRHGYRPYSVSLPQDRDLQIPGYPAGSMAQGDYGTSSFWRYIANSHPTGWKNLLVQGTGKTPGLFDTPLTSTSKNWRKEVKWVDDWLRVKFNLRLRDMYAMFVNNFAYRLAPFNRYGNNPAEDNLDHWAGVLFDQCAEVTVPAGGSQNFTLVIQQLAAGCVWVQTTGANGFVQVSFTAGTDDRTLLESLTVGLAGTVIVSRAAPIADLQYGPYPHLASWRDYPQDGTKKTLYVISNVSTEPQNSATRQVTVTASVPNNSNSARSEGALPPAKVAKRPMKPSYSRKAKSMARQKSATSKMVQEQVNLDKKSLNANVSNATHLARRPRAPDCSEPFKYQPCGPQMSLSLSVMPGTWATLGHSNTQGGAGGQVLGSLAAMAATSTTDGEETMRYLAEVTDNMDGSSVSITIPLIDYGSGASFSNASISVSMAGGESYSAIGPMDANNWPPLTGQVTIEEYSPFVIRGSFSANLAEFLPGAGIHDPPIYTPRGNVSGTFTSVAPFLADERSVIIQDSHEQIADDALNSMGISPEMANKLKEEGKIPGGSSGAPGGGSGGGGGGGVVTPECTCECDMKEFADELCNMLCEEEFAACK